MSPLSVCLCFLKLSFKPHDYRKATHGAFQKKKEESHRVQTVANKRCLTARERSEKHTHTETHTQKNPWTHAVKNVDKLSVSSGWEYLGPVDSSSLPVSRAAGCWKLCRAAVSPFRRCGFCVFKKHPPTQKKIFSQVFFFPSCPRDCKRWLARAPADVIFLPPPLHLSTSYLPPPLVSVKKKKKSGGRRR